MRILNGIASPQDILQLGVMPIQSVACTDLEIRLRLQLLVILLEYQSFRICIKMFLYWQRLQIQDTFTVLVYPVKMSFLARSSAATYLVYVVDISGPYQHDSGRGLMLQLA